MATLKERLLEDLKKSMKENNDIKKNTIQLIRASILQTEKDNLKPLTEKEIEEIIFKEKKKREDVLDQFEKSGREDLIQQTKKELICIQAYLPQPISEYDLKIEMEKIIKDLDATSKDLGKVIKTVKEEFGNRASGKMISDIAKQLLNI